LGISTHILDTAIGRPAAQVPVALASAGTNNQWTILNRTATDHDGRCPHLLPPNIPLTEGLYAIRFDTAAYYDAQHIPGLYPYVEITFMVEPGQAHYHIPLLLTANGYTTYRGS
jgi:5-hydroxyisourate hydrolase